MSLLNIAILLKRVDVKKAFLLSTMCTSLISYKVLCVVLVGPSYVQTPFLANLLVLNIASLSFNSLASLAEKCLVACVIRIVHDVYALQGKDSKQLET